MKSYKGIAVGKRESIGILTQEQRQSARGNYILVCDSPQLSDLGYAGYICCNSKLPIFAKSGVSFSSLSNFEEEEGNIAFIDSEGTVSIFWDKRSAQNALFLTEACNASCKMCPQPPKKHDPFHAEIAGKILNFLQQDEVNNICITGGEPTLLGKNFVSLLNRCVTEHPDSMVEVLTNGQTLANFDFVKQIAGVATHNVRFCVSLHADLDDLHDGIVRTNGAFHRVHSGLFNLARFGLSTEIRFVVCKDNYGRLPKLPEFFFRTYPFVEHFVIMGLEMTGHAEINAKDVWIDPIDYQTELADFVIEARRRNLPFSLYNYQRCVIPKICWSYARHSISDWKQDYASACGTCREKADCGGVFTTSENRLSRGISPFL